LSGRCRFYFGMNTAEESPGSAEHGGG